MRQYWNSVVRVAARMFEVALAVLLPTSRIVMIDWRPSGPRMSVLADPDGGITRLKLWTPQTQCKTFLSQWMVAKFVYPAIDAAAMRNAMLKKEIREIMEAMPRAAYKPPLAVTDADFVIPEPAVQVLRIDQRGTQLVH